MASIGHVLVTGGAGYVGSHCVADLIDQGAVVTVADDLSQGHAAAISPRARFAHVDLRDGETTRALFRTGRFDAVIHCAARSLVGESMRDPIGYMHHNVLTSLNVIAAAIETGARRIVLSSTANLYGTPDRQPIGEAFPLDPGSPYGESKLAVERTLIWAERCHGIAWASLRYFNAAGADPHGRLGEDHDPETHLIPLAIDAAAGRRPPLSLFGEDYPTPDGTCIRDYVHVSDLAAAHRLVLRHLDHGGRIYNLGTGRGYSVREVIAAVERVTGRPVPVRIAPRRPGDPATLVATAARIEAELGWTPRFTSLDAIVESAWRWREAHPHGYRTAPTSEPALSLP